MKGKKAPKSKSHTEYDRNISPKLRMCRNGDTAVNLCRAEHNGALAARTSALVKDIPLVRGKELKLPVKPMKIPRKPPKLKKVTDDILVNLFINIDESAACQHKLLGETGRIGNVVTSQVKLSQVEELATAPGVSYITIGDTLKTPNPDVSLEDIARPHRPKDVKDTKRIHGNGEGVLIGIIDVQGFDFTHGDFLDEDGNTRFIRIWDQGGQSHSSPAHGQIAPYDYGAELTELHLNAALTSAGSAGVSALDLEPQSQMIDKSHGTHVVSIAAGNTGICSRATLAAVLIDLSQEDLDRRRSFYDSTRIAHAVDYLFRLGDYLGMPVSINISLGTNGHAHDASSPVSRWIDAELAKSGRSVCVAAGNAGQEAPTHDQDFGFVMGRIHTSGQITASGLDHDILWNVVGNGLIDISENELEIWCEPQDRIAISIRTPDGAWIGPVEPGQFIENHYLDDGSFVSIYNEIYHPANGANYIAIYLTPFLSPDPNKIVGVKAGQWAVRLHGREIRDGRFHGWIERDDPRPIGETNYWFFPSFFASTSNVDNSSVSSLACGHRIISVANLDQPTETINITSSQGPTRDGRTKPEVAAPGTNIIAARGFGLPDQEWVSMSGTSMASPYVAGVVGLMLAVEPHLTAAQIGGIIRRTARPLPGGNFNWVNDAGFGRIDIPACINEAKRVTDREEVDV